MGTNNLTGKNYGVTTIATVVSYILDEYDLTERYSEFAESIATKVIRGFKDMNLYHLDNRKVVWLPISDQNTCDLPLDYVNYVKIGIEIHGKVWTLTANPNIVLNRVPECGQEIRTVINSGGQYGENYGYYFPDHFRNGRFIGGLYGQGGGWNKAYYRIDKERNQIVLDGLLSQRYLILEYVSTGVPTNSQLIIPQQAVEPLIAFYRWISIRNSKDVPRYMKDEAMETYQMEIMKMREFESQLTKEEYQDIIWEASKQSPKR